jgi:hypothetical protein
VLLGGPNGDLYLDWINDFYRKAHAACDAFAIPTHDPVNNVDGCHINF